MIERAARVKEICRSRGQQLPSQNPRTEPQSQRSGSRSSIGPRIRPLCEHEAMVVVVVFQLQGLQVTVALRRCGYSASCAKPSRTAHVFVRVKC